MPDQRVPLSATEEAYLAHVIAGHAAAVRKADQQRAEMVDVLLADKGIAPGTLVRTQAREGDEPAYLLYDVPETPAPPETPDAS